MNRTNPDLAAYTNRRAVRVALNQRNEAIRKLVAYGTGNRAGSTGIV
jgi:hypothetical protein